MVQLRLVSQITSFSHTAETRKSLRVHIKHNRLHQKSLLIPPSENNHRIMVGLQGRPVANCVVQLHVQPRPFIEVRVVFLDQFQPILPVEPPSNQKLQFTRKYK